MKNTLSDALSSKKTLLIDGGFGSLLLSRGGDKQSGLNNIMHPELVLSLHREYVDAGSDFVTSNTFSLNRVYAGKQGISPADEEKALHAGMELAVKAAASQALVLADMGPSGEMLAPMGTGNPDELLESFARQAGVMAEYKPAAIIIETVFDLKEAEIMVNACKEAAPDIPVLLSLTLSTVKRGGATLMGNRATDIAQAATDWGCAAVGANCGDLNPQDYVEILGNMRGITPLPLLLQPNAGKPVLQGGEVIYPLLPEDFAQGMVGCKEAGAQLLGGCCGTTPAHIAAMARIFK